MATVEATRRHRGRRTLAIGIALAAFGSIGAGVVATPAGAAKTAHGRIIQKPCLDLNETAFVHGTKLACIPYNTTISIACADAGDQVRGPYGVTRIWDKTTYNSKTGYVADAWVYTGTNNSVAPSCLGPGKGRIVNSPCLRIRVAPSLSAAASVCIPFNTVIVIDCTKQGEKVTGPWAPSTVWDHTTYGAATGYVPDARVYTGTSAPNAHSC
jgi:uncharacterized protein YgiM (DUF1202 family)